MPYCIGFIDAGYFKAAVARTVGIRQGGVRPITTAVVTWLRNLAATFPEEQFLRAYWYDGQHDPSHARYGGQRVYFDAIAGTPGVQLRAGHLVERTPKWQAPIRRAIRESAQHFQLDPDRFLANFEQRFKLVPEWQQKGVDTLITLDLVRLAQQAAYGTGVLVSGDRDLAEAVRTAQALGRRIVVAHPAGDAIATELRQLADRVVAIPEDEIATMFTPRAGAERAKRVPAGT